MKFVMLLLSVFLFSVSALHAQLNITAITAKNKERFLVTTIGYTMTGLYTYPNQLQPFTQLNPDGTGVIQNDDLTKENIIWGIECTKSGIPIFVEGFNSAKYALWYKKVEVLDTENTIDNGWTLGHFSIHYDKKKMYIFGDRVKTYID